MDFIGFNLTSSPVWNLIATSDLLTKNILLGLFLLSLWCTTLTFYKIFLFRRHLNQVKSLLDHLSRTKTYKEVQEIAHLSSHYFYAPLFQVVVPYEQKYPFSGKIPLEEAEYLLQSAIEYILFEEEKYLSLLSVSAATSPLIGLFGTIWGLIYAFLGIAQQKSADITVVAPGIAAALLTTFAGLVVAIPTLVSFHYLTGKMKKLEHQLFLCADKISILLKSNSL